jgi:hypothetical protein
MRRLAVSAVYQGLSGVHRELCDGPWIIHFFCDTALHTACDRLALFA